jgi:hypothetical protein
MSSALPSFDSPSAAKLSKFLSQQEERSDAFKKPVERAIKDLQKLVVSKSIYLDGYMISKLL